MTPKKRGSKRRSRTPKKRGSKRRSGTPKKRGSKRRSGTPKKRGSKRRSRTPKKRGSFIQQVRLSQFKRSPFQYWQSTHQIQSIPKVNKMQYESPTSFEKTNYYSQPTESMKSQSIPKVNKMQYSQPVSFEKTNYYSQPVESMKSQSIQYSQPTESMKSQSIPKVNKMQYSQPVSFEKTNYYSQPVESMKSQSISKVNKMQKYDGLVYPSSVVSAVSTKPQILPQVNINSSINENTPILNAEKVYNIYESGYNPPAWILEFMKNSNWKEFASSTKLYYDSKDDISDVIRMATEREPVNMGGSKHFKVSEMQKIFGWSQGYYNTYYTNHKTLPPNIAVYTRTPMCVDESIKINAPLSSVNRVNIHVINVIGCAFDAVNQVDYKYFLRDIPQTIRRSALTNAYISVFDKIFLCAHHNKMKTIVLSLVGLNAFSDLYPDKNELHQSWLDAFSHSLKNHAQSFKAVGVKEISVMGGGKSVTASKLCDISVDNGFISDSYGYIPAIIINKLNNRLDTTLFVNAWDMLSFAGNGNFGDGSLDGRFGRWSAISFLCWPLTNPSMLDKDNMIRT